MNVVYVSNDRYAKYLGVGLYSLYENNKSSEYLDVYIVSTGISSESVAKLEYIAEEFNRKLHIIDFSDIAKKFNFKVNTSRFDISALGRLFLDELLPLEVNRVIYLDCDTVVVDSLEKLYETDLGNNMIGACIEPTINYAVKEYLGINKEESYYNSGVLLIDLDKYRLYRAREKVINCLEEISGVSIFSDQDAINRAFSNLIKPLNPRYNFITNYLYWRYEHLVKMSPSFGSIGKNVWDEAVKKPAIIHFAGDERPWKKWNFNPCKSIYSEYKNKSTFGDEKDDDASFIYMFMYHCMNVFTPLFPRMRVVISNFFINRQREKIKKWYR